MGSLPPSFRLGIRLAANSSGGQDGLEGLYQMDEGMTFTRRGQMVGGILIGQTLRISHSFTVGSTSYIRS